MATSRAQSAGGSINNDGGISMGTKGSSIGTDSPMSSGVNGLFGGLDEANTGGEYGSEVKTVDRGTNPYHDHVGIKAANSAGAFGFTPKASDRSASDPQFIIRGVSTTVGGVTNDVLTSAGSKYAGQNTEKYGSQTVNTTKMLGSGAAIDILEPTSSGIAPFRTKGSGAGNPITFITPSGVTGDEVSSTANIKPTRAVPGELAYMQGGVVPKQDDYKDKDSNE
tara:strand:+ start:220 stop:888 length:669 start_codon:yes stop_codon:yes gene_type:complete